MQGRIQIIAAFVLMLVGLSTVTVAQEIKYPSAGEAVKSVLWEIAQEAGGVTGGANMALNVLETLTLDHQMYEDVAKGIYWANQMNRTYENDWGTRVPDLPQGKDLRDVLVRMKEEGLSTEQEITATREVLRSIPTKDLSVRHLPKSVQRKIRTAAQLSVNEKRHGIVKAAVEKCKATAGPSAETTQNKGVGAKRQISYRVYAGKKKEQQPHGQIMLAPGTAFTALNIPGGGSANDFAQCVLNEKGHLHAYYRDSTAKQGVNGPSVSSGSSKAIYKHYSCECWFSDE